MLLLFGVSVILGLIGLVMLKTDGPSPVGKAAKEGSSAGGSSSSAKATPKKFTLKPKSN